MKFYFCYSLFIIIRWIIEKRICQKIGENIGILLFPIICEKNQWYVIIYILILNKKISERGHVYVKQNINGECIRKGGSWKKIN